jgi:hypothetical protein
MGFLLACDRRVTCAVARTPAGLYRLPAVVHEDRTPPFVYDVRRRRQAAAARRAIRKAGLTSVADLKATPRPKLMRVLSPVAYDVVNDALNRGDEAKLRELIAEDR